MKLFLIRHGETVDNVAHIYAGTLDSALTIHGSLQAERLGQHFAQAGLRFTHIFSSDLQRAYKTADAIRLAQVALEDDRRYDGSEITALTVLREQDFGSLEGKPIYPRQQGSDLSGKELYRSQNHTNPKFKDAESKESMNRRMHNFLRDHIIPLLYIKPSELESIVCIISHGIILSHLWRCFLKNFPKESVVLAPGTTLGTSSPILLEYLGKWSNTGYLELEVQKSDPRAGSDVEDHRENLVPLDHSSIDQNLIPIMSHLKMILTTINGQDHLKSLKRTRGGVGSSKYDEGQKKMESFFKKTTVG